MLVVEDDRLVSVCLFIYCVFLLFRLRVVRFVGMLMCVCSLRIYVSRLLKFVLLSFR